MPLAMDSKIDTQLSNTVCDRLVNMTLIAFITMAAFILETEGNICGDKKHIVEENKCIGIQPGNGTWFFARISCKDRGANLLTMKSAKTLAFLKKEYPSLDRTTYWIGLKDAKGYGKFHWSDRSALNDSSYVAWAPSNPSKTQEKHCVALVGWKWKTEECENVHEYICEISDVDKCQSHNGGCEQTCKQEETGPVCGCFPGFKLKRKAFCTDIDECAGSNHCEEGCTNTHGSFICKCKIGFTPVNNICEDVDECQWGNGGCNDKACVNTVGSFSCQCHTGFFEDSVDQQCKDLDECTKGLCQNGNCTNNIGSYECDRPCTTGYRKIPNGDCIDVNECIKPDTCPKFMCKNNVGSYECGCFRGHVEANGTCADIDECAKNGKELCGEATCINVPHSFKCACNHGYKFIAKKCKDINECMYDNGGCEHICINDVGNFTCECYERYTKLKEIHCQEPADFILLGFLCAGVIGLCCSGCAMCCYAKQPRKREENKSLLKKSERTTQESATKSSSAESLTDETIESRV